MNRNQNKKHQEKTNTNWKKNKKIINKKQKQMNKFENKIKRDRIKNEQQPKK